MNLIEVLNLTLLFKNIWLLIKSFLRAFSDFWSGIKGVSFFWGDIVGSELFFVLCQDPTFYSHEKANEAAESQEELPGEQVAIITEGAFESYIRIISFLSENFHFRAKPENVRYRDFAQQEGREKHWVFIGRGNGNIATAKICHAIKRLEYHFWDPVDPWKEGDRRIKNRNGEVIPQWSRVWDSNSRRDVIDRAMVVKAENPFCPGKKVLIIAGAHAHGTVAAVKFLTDPKCLNELRKEFKKRGVDWKKDFQFFIEQTLQPEDKEYFSIENPKLIKDSVRNLGE